MKRTIFIFCISATSLLSCDTTDEHAHDHDHGGHTHDHGDHEHTHEHTQETFKVESDSLNNE